MISQNNFNALVEEILPKIDELARNVDRISLDVDSLKLRSIPPKHDINESLKAMRISIDECKERTARMRAKKDCFVKACSSSFYETKDEDLKVIDMKEGNIRFQFILMKGMEHFPRNKVKLPYESIMRATYELSAKDGTT